MGSDWTTGSRDAVRYGYRFDDGTTMTCANDAHSIVDISRDGIAALGYSTPEVAFSPGYLTALSNAVRAGRDPLNVPFADAVARDAAATPGSQVSPETLKAVVWAAYYFQNNSGVVGYGTPQNVILDEPVTYPTVGTSPPPSDNGQINDANCSGITARPTPGAVPGWLGNPLVVLGLIVAGAMMVNALNQRAPTIKEIGRRSRK